MPVPTKTVGLIGLGNMGSNVARVLRSNGYSIVAYNKGADSYAQFAGDNGIYLSKDINDFAGKLHESEGPARIWVMIPGGKATNAVMSDLSAILRKDDIVMDASNSMYTDSIANYGVLRQKGIRYLDVGCAGGPDDLLKGVALMVGGDRAAFDGSKDIFSAVCGSGTYGYTGGKGSGHMAKLVHNTVFYGIFPVYSEGVELLLKMKEANPGLDATETIRLLANSPPINTGIMGAISATVKSGVLPDGPAPKIGISQMVEEGVKTAAEIGVSMSITNAILAGYGTMSEASRKIYGAAKRKLTGH